MRFKYKEKVKNCSHGDVNTWELGQKEARRNA